MYSQEGQSLPQQDNARPDSDLSAVQTGFFVENVLYVMKRKTRAATATTGSLNVFTGRNISEIYLQMDNCSDTSSPKKS